MNTLFTYGEEIRRSRSFRTMRVALQIGTNRRAIVASYTGDGFQAGFIELQVLRTLAHCPSVVDLIEEEQGAMEARPEISVAYEALDTDFHLFRRAMPGMRLTQERIQISFHQLATGLRAAHGALIVLRDLRPDKIRVTEDPFRVKLSDFAGAKIVHPGAVQGEDLFTPPGALDRCLSYQAPEQLIGSRKYTSAVDMWALGCIMVEVATGKVLFAPHPTDHPRTHLEFIYALLGTPPSNPYPSDVAQQWETQMTFEPELDLYAYLLPFFGEDGSRLIMRLLCFDPDMRITAQGVLDDIYFQGIGLA